MVEQKEVCRGAEGPFTHREVLKEPEMLILEECLFDGGDKIKYLHSIQKAENGWRVAMGTRSSEDRAEYTLRSLQGNGEGVLQTS